MAIDAFLIAVAVWAAFALRLADVWPEMLSRRWWLLLAMPAVTIPIFKMMRLYRTVVRHLGPQFGLALVYGVSLSALCMPFMVLLAQQAGEFSRAAAVIYWFLAIVTVGGVRLLGRSWFRIAEQGLQRPAIIYGAGEAGVRLQSALAGSERFRIVAFIDDDPSSWRTVISGSQVHGPTDLPDLIKRSGCRDIFLAMPSIDRAERRRIIERLRDLDLTVHTVPSMAELIDGTAQLDEVRPIDIEDLLGRDVVEPHRELLDRCIAGRVVLVSGAGGSIGSELCRQILRLKPRRLILLERSEVALYDIDSELNEILAAEQLDVDLVPVLGSAGDSTRIRALLRSFVVDTVYHAAAYKHVPLVEYNLSEGVRNNVLTTQVLAEAAGEAGVSAFVFISTDKAVRPTNTMGASKRLAELVLQGLQHRLPDTRFCMVRFGNVLASSGSVVPRFKSQIAAGGPLTVTHPEIIRYFMTIPEAAQLVIQAGSMGEGGDVFVLDMGEAVKIVDLARLMIRLAGRTERTADDPHGDIEIQFTGLRPGEKLYEELLIGDDVTGTDHPMIMRANEAELAADVLAEGLAELQESCADQDAERTLALLRRLVGEFQPDRTMVDVLWRAQAERAASESLPFRPPPGQNADPASGSA